MANQDTSIGSDSANPVDGIAGTNPGTQQPSGAHVDAGQPGAAGGQPEQLPEIRRPGSGQNHEGVAQPSGVTGVMGTSARRPLQPGQLDQMMRAAVKYNGSLSLAGKTVGVRIGCGALSRQTTH